MATTYDVNEAMTKLPGYVEHSYEDAQEIDDGVVEVRYIVWLHLDKEPEDGR